MTSRRSGICLRSLVPVSVEAAVDQTPLRWGSYGSRSVRPMTDYSDPVASLAELREMILGSREETELGRRVPHAVGEELAVRGFGRLVLPRSAPGHELDPATYMTVLEELATAEASVALVVWNNCLPALVSRHLDDAVRAEIFADPKGMYANSTRPVGRALETSTGLTVSGRWSLVTGCQLAGWFALMCVAWDPAADRPVKIEGRPRMIMAMIPVEKVDIVDTWRAAGVRGSGSHDVVVNQVEVPAERVVDFAAPNQLADLPIGRVPWMSLLAAGHGAISLGIARSASEAFVELIAGKVAVDTAASVADHPALQVEFLDANERVEAARSRLRQSVDRIWSHVLDHSTPPLEAIADIYGGARHAAAATKALTEVTLRWGGTSALYTDCPIERAWRDVHAIDQHVIVSPLTAEQAGRVRLGLAPSLPTFAW